MNRNMNTVISDVRAMMVWSFLAMMVSASATSALTLPSSVASLAASIESDQRIYCS